MPPLRRRHPCPPAAGFTLTELLLVGALAAVLLTTALPSFQSFLLRRHLNGQSAQWLADLQFLRASAAARQSALRLTWLHSEAGSGWVIHDGAADACQPSGSTSSGSGGSGGGVDAPIACASGTLLLRSVWLPANGRVAVQANVASMRVDPRQGTLSPTGSWELVAADGMRLRHVVNLLGRVRVCAPAAPLSGVPAC
jgi:type IV fimbrial biogenesis protein FimT